MTETPTPHTRNLTLDVLKGILTAGMVWGHMTGGYTGVTNNVYVEAVRLVLMMAIFSGFMFSMGYVMHGIYFAKEKPPVSKMIRSSFRSLAGYYISALGYFLIFKSEFNWQTVGSVLSLRQLGSISEFLLPFALVPLAAILLTTPLKKYVLISDRNTYVVIFILLLTTFLPYDRIHSPYLALFLGSARGVYYPVVQFFSVFLLGVHFASRKIEIGWTHFAVGAFALAVVVSSSLLGSQVSRFPPSFGWVVLSTALVFLFYKIAQALSHSRALTSILAPIGANSLFILVTSNLLIFGLSRGMIGALDTLTASALAVVILTISFLLMTFVRTSKA